VRVNTRRPHRRTACPESDDSPTSTRSTPAPRSTCHPLKIWRAARRRGPTHCDDLLTGRTSAVFSLKKIDMHHARCRRPVAPAHARPFDAPLQNRTETVR
jgi:hypothetical protein